MAEAEFRMEQFDNQHWHLVGILGTGMKALAHYASERGVRITGSDVQPSPSLKELASHGIEVHLDQKHSHFAPDTNRVVVSQAISAENPELMEARRMGIEVVKYPQLLGELMDSQPGIAVAGSHGKSTTSSMAAFIMQKCGLDPSYLIGADVPQLGGGSHYGMGRYLVAEACEYKRSFLYLNPEIAVITNIDREHMDYYRDMEELEEALCQFASQIRPDGVLVLNADDPHSKIVEKAAGCRIVKFSMQNARADFSLNRVWRAKKHTNYNLIHKGRDLGRFALKLYGNHNIYNALAAIAACHAAGVDPGEAAAVLSHFEGAARRLQLLGEPWNVAVLSDYAHHPNEIKASLSATKQQFPNRRIFCIFQPHQYSRTRKMLTELADTLEESWMVLVADIYAARDSARDRESVSSMDLVRLINEDIGMKAHYVPDFDDIEDIIVREVVPEDVILVMGAGNIFQIAHDIVPKIQRKGERQYYAA